MKKTPIALILTIIANIISAAAVIWSLNGCSALRHYELAKGHCEGVKCKDTSAGDVTHASEPGARVVVPKKKH